MCHDFGAYGAQPWVLDHRGMESAMSYTLSRAEIEAVFVEMNLPLIERGMDEIQTAKDRLVGIGQLPSGGGQVIQRMIVSNGTGKLTSANQKNAQLERRSL